MELNPLPRVTETIMSDSPHGQIASRLGRTIRQLRLNRGLSQTDFALRCQINRGYLSRVECGKTVPFWENMERFALTLGIEVWEIVQMAEAPSEEGSNLQTKGRLKFRPIRLGIASMDLGANQASAAGGLVPSRFVPSPHPGAEVLSSKTGLPDSPTLEKLATFARRLAALPSLDDTLHPAPQSTVQPETESQESIPAEATGTDIYRVSGSGHPTLIEAASHSPSPVSANEPISEPELETSTFGGWQVI